jgi:hypothetical protein
MVAHGRLPRWISRISRRAVLQAGATAGAAGMNIAAVAANPARATQDDNPPGMRSEHFEVVFTPVDPVSITLAGGGPPQRGDYFYVDGPIYASGDVNGVRIGTYQCFGAWTAAADDVDAPTQRLTTVQFQLADGIITALVNEAGTTGAFGAIQGGNGRFLGAIGTVQQIGVQPPGPDVATPNVPGTPNPGQYVLRAIFDLMLPQGS